MSVPVLASKGFGAAELALVDNATSSPVKARPDGSLFSLPAFANAADESSYNLDCAEAFVRRIPLYLLSTFVTSAAILIVRLLTVRNYGFDTVVGYLISISCVVYSSLIIIFLNCKTFLSPTRIRIVVEVCIVCLTPMAILLRPTLVSETFMALYGILLTANILRPSGRCMIGLILMTVASWLISILIFLPNITDVTVQEHPRNRIAEGVLISAVLVFSVFSWFKANKAERLAFFAGRTLKWTWRATGQMLAAALPHQILPAFLEYTSANRDWSGVPATAEPDVTIIFVRFPPLSHSAFPLTSAAAVTSLNGLFELCDTIVTPLGVTVLEVTNTEFVGIVGLREGGCNVKDAENARVACRAGLAIMAALPRAFADVTAVGVDCGPGIAGFVGTLRPHFTLVGGTISGASCMASVALPGGMTVSATTFARLGAHFQATERVVQLDGRGPTGVFDITGSVASADAPPISEAVAVDILATAPSAVKPAAEAIKLQLRATMAPEALSTRFAAQPFTLLGGFFDKDMEARYNTRPDLHLHSNSSTFMALIIVVFIIFSEILAVDRHSIQRLWVNVALLVIAIGLSFASYRIRIASDSRYHNAAMSADIFVFLISSLIAPFFMQELTVAAEASIVILFCPNSYLTPRYQCIVLVLHLVIITTLALQDYYVNGQMVPTTCLWIWLSWMNSTFLILQLEYVSRVQYSRAEALREAQGLGAAVIRHILPRLLIDRIKAGDELNTITTQNEDVAVLVADIVGFTALSASAANPAVFFDLVNDAFREFERVAHAEGAFKVKTIGDCIVFTAGLRDFPGPAADRAARVALLSRVASGLHAAATFLELKMRIGIHVGSLVSGVMNCRGFVYDVWGEGILNAMSAENAAPVGGTAFTPEAAMVLDYATAQMLTPGSQRVGVGSDGLALRPFFNLVPIDPNASVRGVISGRSLIRTRSSSTNDSVNSFVDRSGFLHRLSVFEAPEPAAGSGSEVDGKGKFGFGVWSWSWDVLRNNDVSSLPKVALELLRPSLIDGMISEKAAAAVTASLCASYSQLPYHNAFHGVATMQAALLIARSVPAARSALVDFEMILLSFAALGHDAGHRGFGNAYEVAARSSIALNHGIDGPVLERFHSAITVAVVEASGVLAHLTSSDCAAALHTITAAIMATDMVRHDTIVGDLTRCGSLSALTTDTLMGALVHCADLSAHAFPHAIADRWADRIAAEFFNQVASEVSSGLPTANFMHGLDMPLARARLQSGFNNGVAAPLWRALAALADDALEEPLRNIQLNATIYATKCKQYSARMSSAGGIFSLFIPNNAPLPPQLVASAFDAVSQSSVATATGIREMEASQASLGTRSPMTKMSSSRAGSNYADTSSG